MFACNVDEQGIGGNLYVDIVEQVAVEQGAGMVVICAEVEAEIALLDPDDREGFLEELGLHEPGLAVLAREAYDLLHLDTFFTVGPKEIRAWTVRHGASASKAAGVIHTDFERGFIRAEVYSIPDLLEHGSETALRSVGKIRVEGRDYVVKDGDVIYFRFNV
jgi:ribosome-binding ATPase YchF (GTP1/OBG family)